MGANGLTPRANLMGYMCDLFKNMAKFVFKVDVVVDFWDKPRSGASGG
jgi:hypothetical protein